MLKKCCKRHFLTETIIGCQKVLVSKANCEVDWQTGVHRFPSTRSLNLELDQTVFCACFFTVALGIIFWMKVSIEADSYFGFIRFKLQNLK